MFSYYVYEKPGKESYGTVERYHTGKGIGILLAEVLLIIFNLLFSEQTPEAEQKEQQKKQWCFLGHCMAGAGQSFPDICSGSRRRSVRISVI